MRKAQTPFQSLFYLAVVASLVVPACRKHELKPLPSEPGPVEILTQILAQRGLDPKAIRQFRDESGGWHFKLEMSQEDYQAVYAQLEAELAKAGATVEKKEESQTEEADYFLWQVTGKNQERLRILFACLIPAKPAEPTSKKRVAVIMDDLGYSLEAVQTLCSLKKPVTVSILPFAPLTEPTAELARNGGLEMMLHLPLESLGRGQKRGPGGMISTGMKREEIRRNVEACLRQVPAAKGVNNHTGSKVTEDADTMRVILEVLKDKGLYFIDSRTTRNTVAFDLARRMGVPSASRAVFIDTVETEPAIRLKLEELFRLARQRGSAVGICHPREETLRVLQGCASLAERYGVELVFASELAGRGPAPQVTPSKKGS